MRNEKMEEVNKIVISLGGSVYYPKEFRKDYLMQFLELLCNHFSNKPNTQYLIVCGGGASARQRIAQLNGSDTEKHLAAIEAVNDNCSKVLEIFKKKLEFHENVIIDLASASNIQKHLVAGAKYPGHTTDWVAVMLAKAVGAKTVINVSNIDFVFDKDPNKFKDAVPITEISWSRYSSFFGDVAVPGGNYPFDPVASKEAREGKIEVIILNGNKLDKVSEFLKSGYSQKIGTRIH